MLVPSRCSKIFFYNAISYFRRWFKQHFFILQEEVDKIFNDLKAESDKTPPSRGDDGEFDEEIKTKEYRDQGRWKRDPIFKVSIV